MKVDDCTRVAVATEDGIVCNFHFGEIEQVSVYGISPDGEVFFIERRAFPGKESFGKTEGCGCHGGNQEYLAEVCKSLAGCRYLLVEKAGTAPARILLRNGIEILEQRGNVNELLSTLCRYINRKKKGRTES